MLSKSSQNQLVERSTNYLYLKVFN